MTVATKSEIIIYTSDGHRKAAVGNRSKRGYKADYIAVQISNVKNLVAAIDNSDNSVCIFGMRRQQWMELARVKATGDIRLQNPLSLSFDFKVNNVWILDLSVPRLRLIMPHIMLLLRLPEEIVPVLTSGE